jgi:hypothetical protein
MHEKICSYLVLMVVTLGVSACGGPSSAPPETASSQRQAASEQSPEACQALTADFIDSLDRLRGRLVTKIAYAQYVEALKEIRKSYDGLPVGRLPGDCLKGPGALAEETFNMYIKAANTWTRCVTDSACEVATLMPVIEKMWWAAGLSLSRVHTAMQDHSTAYAEGLPPPPS